MTMADWLHYCHHTAILVTVLLYLNLLLTMNIESSSSPSKNGNYSRGENDEFLTKLYNFYGNRTNNLIKRYSYLINKTNGAYIKPVDFLDVREILNPSEGYQTSVSAIMQLFDRERTLDFINRMRRDHSYSNLNTMIEAGQPVADKHLCYKQMRALRDSLMSEPHSLLFTDPGKKQLLYYLDSFGRPESSTYMGNSFWLGSYKDCSDRQLNLNHIDDGHERDVQQNRSVDGMMKRFKTRYCIGKLRHRKWPKNDTISPKTSIKIGLCLPESCDTVAFYYDKLHNSGDLLRRHLHEIMELNFGPLHSDFINLVDMYCLPDERSPLRKLSTSSYIYLGLCGTWLAVVFLASLLYNIYGMRSHEDDTRNRLNNNISDKSNRSSLNDKNNYHQSSQYSQSNLDETMLRQTSMVMNQIDKVINDMDESNQPMFATTGFNHHNLDDSVRGRSATMMGGHIHNIHSSNNTKTNINERNQCGGIIWRMIEALAIGETIDRLFMVTKRSGQGARVNLGALNFFKTVCTGVVVVTHLTWWRYFIGNNRSNEMISYSNSFTFHVVLNGIRAVDLFYVIAGVLVGYLTIKEYARYSINLTELLKPREWLYIQMTKYLRVAPVYLLMYWYSKSLAVYTGKGPVWDYGTDIVSFRSSCLNEEWYKSILYFGNFGSDVLPWCSEVSWYLVSYVQIFLILPFVMYLVYRFPFWNILIVGMLISVPVMVTFYNKFNQDLIDSSALVLFPFIEGLLDFKFMLGDYTSTLERVVPMVVGIVGGYYIYLYERSQITEWPRLMRGYYFLFHLFSFHYLSMAAALPKIFFLEELFKEMAKVEFLNVILPVLCQTTYPIFAVVIIIRLVTDLAGANFVTRIMSHKFWAITNEFTFCAYLIHYEVIYYGLTADYKMEDVFNDMITIKESSWPLVIVSVISCFVYVLYEAPMDRLFKLFLPILRKKHIVKSNNRNIRL